MASKLGRTIGAVAALLTAAIPALGAVAEVGFDREAILTGARALPPHGTIRITAVPWAEGSSSAAFALALERFEVFAPGARIVVHGSAGEERLLPPANVYLRGSVEGEAGSRVVLSVLDSGEIRGLANALGRTWVLGAEPGGGLLRVREVARPLELEQPGTGFRCALDDVGSAAYRADENERPSLPGDELFETAPAAAAPPSPDIFDHTAVIAIETDNEYLAIFGGNTTDATNYAADLIAYASTIYTDEVQTSWMLGDVILWAATDPWVQTLPSCGLIDFGRYWNNNHAAISRTVTHFLSGKSTNAGIAWVGVLCSGAFNIDAAAVATGCSPALTGVSNWGGGYGYTSGIDGNFDINNPAVVWDIMAVTHEIGHNFNSPHTHCYQNLEGNAAAIDQCYGSQTGTGCYLGSTSLPSGCPGSGQGCGTIMSYCHLLGGGMSNTSLSLGLGHPYGIVPSRVPTRMRNHVVSVAAGNAACLAPIGVLFIDGFASGNANAWSAIAP